MATTFTIRFKKVMAGLRQTRKRYKASDHLREHIARFNKSSPELVKIDPKLNDFMMSRVVKGGDKVKVEITKTGDMVNVKLAAGQVAASPVTPAQTPAKSTNAKPAQTSAKPADKSQASKATDPKSNQKPKQEKQAKTEEKQHEQKKQPPQPKPAAPTQAGQ